MNLFQSLLFALVSFGASIAGAICGIGGGVIIKPTLDLFGWASVSTISFLSGCTVLSMSSYSVGKSLLADEKKVDLKTGTPLAIGAGVGGILGKQLFTMIKSMFDNQNTVGGIQAGCLAVITVFTLIYTVNKDRFRTKHVASVPACAGIGLLLGIMSSFLGIGGGRSKQPVYHLLQPADEPDRDARDKNSSSVFLDGAGSHGSRRRWWRNRRPQHQQENRQ